VRGAAKPLSATPLTYFLRRDDSDFVAFCFTEPEDAEVFVKRFGEEPEVQRKAAAFARWHEPDDARYHVRICEGLGVKFPGPTRQV
jgi:hypothetical protein